MNSIDDEWVYYLQNHNKADTINDSDTDIIEKQSMPITENIPKCDDLYISTKTKVLFLNTPIDIQKIFWELPITEYWKPVEGIIKKQIKIINKTEEEYLEYKNKLQTAYYYTERIIKQINNPEARRIKFKDERKITIGISKKDIMNCRCKIKNAFYNCFAMILRFKYEGSFKEIHVKVFNTGKLEIPGILNAEMFVIIQNMIIHYLQPLVDMPIYFLENNKEDNVLINSNFNCGFYINREKLYTILRSDKYGIETAYDPCSYPGVKCKFYFNHEIGFDATLQNGKIIDCERSMTMSELNENKKYTEVSFMIFRTGSCLIVGNCSEKILLFIFDFIKQILQTEYQNIYVVNDEPVNKHKKTKIRKRHIYISE
jgi:hypothetical protein